jgi:hypothetical protein
MSEQQAICKAVEVALTDTFIIEEDATGASQTINPSQTLFPNVLALWSDIVSQITLANTTGAFNYYALLTTLQTPLKCLLVSTGDDLISATGTLAATFGFTGSETPLTPVSGTMIEATYRPKHIWFPTYVSSDSNWFSEDPDEMFSGTMGQDGNLCGLGFNAKQKRKFQWPWDHAYNAIKYANSATAYQTTRCFQQVIHDARGMALAQSGSNNLYCKGVYYIHDVDALTTANSSNTALLPTTWNSGTVVGTYVFCSPGAPVVVGASTAELRSYYDLELELTVGTAPSWGWDITPS